MTAPTINGTKYPQPVDALLPAARKLVDELGEVPSRNRLMREYRIGAPKADELRTLLLQPPAPASTEPAEDPWLHAEPIGPNPLPAPLAPEPTPVAAPTPAVTAVERSAEVTAPGHPGTPATAATGRRAVAWPVVLLALPAFVAIWSGWVGLGGLTGFGVVHPLPGIADGVSLNTAITLPIGVETYGAYALYVWLSGRVPDRARRFAKYSAIGSLAIGSLGQIAYHLLVAPPTGAPWWITTAVSVLPVLVLGMGAALAHLVREDPAR
ncbi:ABC transporter permease [Micromonospora sp. NPDC048930]|uniref:ABC transporter permease n=1 Tax=Micromonospora sp. NPDC048930 TaxID=3364261 RepID=UPI00371FE349